MIDIKFDTSTHDLVIENGDIVLIAESVEVAQAVKARLLTLSSEWILDVGIGMQWQEKIFNVATTNEEKELLIKREILSVTGVRSVSYVTLDVDGTTNIATVTFAGETIYGEAFAGSVTT